MSGIDQSLPVAIIGAGPVGLAAAAQLVVRNLTPVIFERGTSVGTSLLAWSHVRVFSPWAYNIDKAARTLLDISGWDAPEPTELPTGGEIVERYLRPLAALPQIAAGLQLGANVNGITRHNLDKMSNAGRGQAPFDIRWTDRTGAERSTLAVSVIDASGTWSTPNPLGIDGLPVPGERSARDLIAYGIPDVLGSDRAHYAGKATLVVGSGHSAISSALALLTLQDSSPDTRIVWALRRGRIENLLGGGLNDQLPERGALGLAARQAIVSGRLQILAPFAARRLTPTAGRIEVEATLGAVPVALTFDRIIVATGFRPDLTMLSELRIAIDPATESPPALAPLIDPNFHSCGSVPPHGVVELTQPEPGFYIAGSKSYGRAPTFLMATGYEQVRSIADELAGDAVAARAVQLVLPETGVCSSAHIGGDVSSSCCDVPSPSATNRCAADEIAGAQAQQGCGCGGSSRPAMTHAGELVA